MKPLALTTYSILDLIPQRPPVVCVDELIGLTEKGAISRFSIPASHYFVKNEKMTAAGLLENVAQTAAARAGYLALESGEAVSLGFIASFKNVMCHRFPHVDNSIETHIQFEQTVLNMSIFIAQIYCDQKELLTCEIRILIGDM